MGKGQETSNKKAVRSRREKKRKEKEGKRSRKRNEVGRSSRGSSAMKVKLFKE